MGVPSPLAFCRSTIFTSGTEPQKGAGFFGGKKSGGPQSDQKLKDFIMISWDFIMIIWEFVVVEWELTWMSPLGMTYSLLYKMAQSTSRVFPFLTW